MGMFRITGMMMAAALLAGCVSSGTYQAKEQEAVRLNRSLSELQTTHDELVGKYDVVAKERDGLSDRLGKATLQLEEAGKEKERLVAASEAQEKRLKAVTVELADLKVSYEKIVEANRPENLLKTLGGILTEQRQTIDGLQQELKRLKSGTVVEKGGVTQADGTVVEVAAPAGESGEKRQ